MKSIGVREVKEHMSEWLRTSQREAVVVVKHGRPTAVLIGIDGTDPSDAVLAELHRRRITFREHAISSDELARRLDLDPDEVSMWRRRAMEEAQRGAGGFDVTGAAGLPRALRGRRTR